MKARIIVTVIVLVLAVSAVSYVILHLLSSSEALYSVGLGVEFNTHATPVWVALHNGVFSKYGINVGSVLKFRTGLELAAALARGDVKVGWACLGPALLIIDKGIPVKIVAKVHNHGYALVVNSSRIRGIEDLNGAIIYSPGKGSPCYLLLLKIEDVYHIKFKAIKFMSPATLLSALLSGEVYAAALSEHYASVAESKGLKVLVRSQDVWPDMPGSYLVVDNEFLKAHPELVKKLIQVTHEGVESIRHNLSYTALVDSKVLGVSVAVAEHSIRMLDWNTTLNIKEIQEYIDFMYEHGILYNRLNATDLVTELGPQESGDSW